MKKALLVFTVFVLAVAIAVSMGCAKKNPVAGEPTALPTVVPPAGLMIDDGAAKDNANEVPAGVGGPGYWYTYDDTLDTGGNSYVVPMSDTWADAHSEAHVAFYKQAPGYGGAGYAARITGYVTTGYQYGFIGMGVNLLAVNGVSCAAYFDVTATGPNGAYTGIYFWEKGDGQSYSVKIPYIDNSTSACASLEGNDDYAYTFTSTSDWSMVQVAFTSLKQGGFGTAVPLTTVLPKLTAIQFQTTMHPQASVDLWIDNLEFYK